MEEYVIICMLSGQYVGEYEDTFSTREGAQRTLDSLKELPSWSKYDMFVDVYRDEK